VTLSSLASGFALMFLPETFVSFVLVEEEVVDETLALLSMSGLVSRDGVACDAPSCGVKVEPS